MREATSATTVTTAADSAPGGGALAGLAAVTALMACIQIVTLWTGALGAELSEGAALVTLVGSVTAAVLLAGALLREPGTASRPSPAPAFPKWATVVAGLAVAWCAVTYVRLWLLALQRPVYDWDGLYYHVPALHAWAVEGRVSWIADAVDVPFVNYPMGAEALTFFVRQLAAAAAPVTATNLWFWPLGFFALVVIAAQLGARGPWRWLAGALMAGIPVVVTQSVTCYTDPAFAFTVMAALAAALLFVFDGGTPTWARTLLLGAGLGLVAGAKGGGAPVALVLWLASVLAALLVDRGRHLGRRLLASAGLLAIALAVGGYWYARAFMHTGNPIHPIELKFGALVVVPGFDHVAFSAANMPTWLLAQAPLLRLPVSWLQLDAPIQGYAPVGGLGYLWVAIALPAVAVLGVIRTRHRGDPAAMAFALLFVLVGLLLSVQTAPWWSRFTIWLHALGIPALVVVLQLLAGQRGRWVRGLGIAGLISALGVAAWESERTLGIEWARGRNMTASSVVDYTSTMDSFFPGLAAPEFNAFLSARRIARTAWSRQGTLLGGVLAMPLGARNIGLLPRRATRAVLDSLVSSGATWIVWDELAAGAVPDIVSSAALESHRWSSGSEAGFRFLRIAAD